MLSEFRSCHAGEPFMGVLAITSLVVLTIVVGVDLISFRHLDTSWFVVGEIWPLIWDLNNVTSCVNLLNLAF